MAYSLAWLRERGEHRITLNVRNLDILNLTDDSAEVYAHIQHYVGAGYSNADIIDKLVRDHNVSNDETTLAALAYLFGNARAEAAEEDESERITEQEEERILERFLDERRPVEEVVDYFERVQGYSQDEVDNVGNIYLQMRNQRLEERRQREMRQRGRSPERRERRPQREEAKVGQLWKKVENCKCKKELIRSEDISSFDPDRLSQDDRELYDQISSGIRGGLHGKKLIDRVAAQCGQEVTDELKKKLRYFHDAILFRQGKMEWDDPMDRHLYSRLEALYGLGLHDIDAIWSVIREFKLGASYDIVEKLRFFLREIKFKHAKRHRERGTVDEIVERERIRRYLERGFNVNEINELYNSQDSVYTEEQLEQLVDLTDNVSNEWKEEARS